MPGEYRQFLELFALLKYYCIIRHPPYLGAVGVLCIVFEFEEGPVVNGAQRDLRTAADVACDHADTDGIHNVRYGTCLIDLAMAVGVEIAFDTFM